MSSWRDSENYFVTALLDVYSVVDLSSYPLKLVRRTDVRYNGPKDEDYKSLLFKNDLAANHAGRAIVRARKHDNPEEDDYFLVERMVEQVEELKSLLDVTREESVKQQAELGKKDAELAKNNAALAKKDAELAKNKYDLAKKDAELARTKADLAKMEAAPPRTLKQVLLGGDFVEFFRRMKELDSLLKENGVQGVKELKSLLDGTRAELGKKDAELAKNEADLAAKDADLAKKDTELAKNKADLAAKDAELAKNKADLAKKDAELAKNKDDLAKKDAELAKSKADLAKMEAAPPRALKQVSLGGDFVEFFRRMSRTYVNQEEKYINLSFTGTMYPVIPDHENVFVLRYYDKDRHIAQPFSMVQFDAAENPRDELRQVKVSPFNYQAPFSHLAPASAIVDNPSDYDCAFLYSYVCFVGRIRRVNGNFRYNTAVSAFFQKSSYGKNCYVDEVGSTFFVLAPNAEWYRYTHDRKDVPRLLT